MTDSGSGGLSCLHSSLPRGLISIPEAQWHDHLTSEGKGIKAIPIPEAQWHDRLTSEGKGIKACAESTTVPSSQGIGRPQRPHGLTYSLYTPLAKGRFSGIRAGQAGDWAHWPPPADSPV